jgi:Binding-protein-dependent transport system inner membrane component
LGILAARNLTPHRACFWTARGLLNAMRGINELVFALVFVAAVGLGPLPGVLALAVHTAGMLGKFYAEAMEGVDPGPLEALAATGAGRLQTIRYAVLPQVLPTVVAFNLYRLEVSGPRGGPGGADSASPIPGPSSSRARRSSSRGWRSSPSGSSCPTTSSTGGASRRGWGGLLFMTGPLAQACAAPLGGPLGGLAVESAGLWPTGGLDDVATLPRIGFALALGEFGSGLFLVANMHYVMAALPSARQGVREAWSRSCGRRASSWARA